MKIGEFGIGMIWSIGNALEGMTEAQMAVFIGEVPAAPIGIIFWPIIFTFHLK